MKLRPLDNIVLEGEFGRFDRFEAIELTHDLLASSSCKVKLGDDASFKQLEPIVSPGAKFKIFLNGLLQFTGRVDSFEAPGGSEATNIELTLRTKMADARYASADPRINVKGATLKQFILELYAPFGYLEPDFQFAAAADADIVTGVIKGAPAPVDLATIQLDQAKVQPPETVYDAASRHLKRHHMQHWDGADGRILVGTPDDKQDPRYRLMMARGIQSQGNNILDFKRVRDWSEAASVVWAFGGTPTKDVYKDPIKAEDRDPELEAVFARNQHFHRPVLIPNAGSKTIPMAEAAAKRERLARARRKDAWELKVDGWTYWSGGQPVPYAINTTVEIDIHTVGAPKGRYLITKLARSLTPEDGPTTMIEVVAPGVWQL